MLRLQNSNNNLSVNPKSDVFLLALKMEVLVAKESWYSLEICNSSMISISKKQRPCSERCWKAELVCGFFCQNTSVKSLVPLCRSCLGKHVVEIFMNAASSSHIEDIIVQQTSGLLALAVFSPILQRQAYE